MISRRGAAFGLAAVPLLAGPARLHAAPAITVLEGGVRAANAASFFARVAAETDKIVGLKVSLDPAEPLVAQAEDGGRLILFLAGAFRSEKEDEKLQLSFNGGFVKDRGLYRFDGFYLVKYAGMGQGISAYALEPVKESDVLLSGAKRKSVRLR